MFDYAQLAAVARNLLQESEQADRAGDVEAFVRLRGKWLVYEDVTNRPRDGPARSNLRGELALETEIAEHELAAARAEGNEVDIWLWESEIQALAELTSLLD